MRGSAIRRSASTSAKVSTAPATTGLWKAQATGMALADSPDSLSATTAARTFAVGPETTTCLGAFRLASTTSLVRPAPARACATSSAVALTAAMVPGSSPQAPRMAAARSRLRSSRVVASKAPATHRPTSSP
ncbi:hypothetical protein C5N14_26640 [Micromonospora sp. MW-13]|nr:hypothetical protein C5N14_26640 [Micromonospora sp. MW-13]